MAISTNFTFLVTPALDVCRRTWSFFHCIVENLADSLNTSTRVSTINKCTGNMPAFVPYISGSQAKQFPDVRKTMTDLGKLLLHLCLRGVFFQQSVIKSRTGILLGGWEKQQPPLPRSRPALDACWRTWSFFQQASSTRPIYRIHPFTRVSTSYSNNPRRRFPPQIALMFQRVSKDFSVFPTDFRRSSTKSQGIPGVSKESESIR